MNMACARPASDSALPWPKRCSSSAGMSEYRTANRLISDAATSIKESISDAITLTEPVINQAASLPKINTLAVMTEA